MEPANFQLQIVVYDAGDIDKREPILEIDNVLEQMTALEAGKEMLKRVKKLREENPDQSFKLEAYLADEAGNPISVFADD